MTVPILEVCDVHAAYGRIEVLRGVDLSVPKGAVLALLGPNGAGKSTLTRIIAGQKKPTSGDVHLGGVNVRDAAPEQLAPSCGPWPGTKSSATSSGCAPSPRAARCSRT